jgi:hypothetical protein
MRMGTRPGWREGEKTYGEDGGSEHEGVLSTDLLADRSSYREVDAREEVASARHNWEGLKRPKSAPPRAPKKAPAWSSETTLEEISATRFFSAAVGFAYV